MRNLQKNKAQDQYESLQSDYYMPSGKHPNIAVLITFIIIGAIFASIVGVIALILHSYFFFEMIKANFQMYNNPFPHAFHLVAVLMSIAAFMGITGGVGWIGGWISAFNSRNLTKSGITGALTGIFSVIIIIVCFVSLEGRVPKPNVFFYITPTFLGIPSSILVVIFNCIGAIIVGLSGWACGQRGALQPFCESCDRRQTPRIGYIRGRVDSFTVRAWMEKNSFDDLIKTKTEATKSDLAYVAYGEAVIFLCQTCNDTGFVSFFNCWIQKHGNAKETRSEQQIADLLRMNKSQIHSSKIVLGIPIAVERVDKQTK